MSRGSLERRRMAEERWPLLTNAMSAYFSRDFEVIDGSLRGTIDAATTDGSLDHRRALLDEWRDWNVTKGTADDIRPFLTDGFGIGVWFASAIDARNFMNRIYDGLVISVRVEASGSSGAATTRSDVD